MKFRKHLISVLLASALLPAAGSDCLSAINSDAPSSTVKLVFVHHSSGENWLTDGNGDLGIALRDNNYFVSDTNYGWGPSNIGDTTDFGNWYDWFTGPSSATYLAALYAESGQHAWYSRLAVDPGGANEIVMFKSCFPNSNLGGNPDDPPTAGANPLRSQDAWSEYMTVANAKGIYNDLLDYFALHPEKLFIAVTQPPLISGDTDAARAANARAFTAWLVEDWLSGYAGNNVAVFDFYNVLTSNGGNTSTNDAGAETGNHHRVHNGYVQHIHTVDQNTTAYRSGAGDSHPSSAGNQKATQEFVSLLNVYYHCWDGSGDCPVAGLRADFAADVSSGYAPLAVNFSDLSSGSVSGWTWDFGDLTGGSVRNPSHTYSDPGSYTVSLTVDDGGAGSHNETKLGYITVEASPYSVSPALGSLGTDIEISGLGFGDSGGKGYLRYIDERGRQRQKPLKIQDWSDAAVAATVKSAPAPGACDIVLAPAGQDVVTLTGGFTAMAPEVSMINPASGAPEEAIVLTGNYFGGRKGKVRFLYMSGERLKKKNCKVVSWDMDPSTGESSAIFTVHKKLAAGLYDVSVSSKVGVTTVSDGFTVE